MTYEIMLDIKRSNSWSAGRPVGAHIYHLSVFIRSFCEVVEGLLNVSFVAGRFFPSTRSMMIMVAINLATNWYI